MRVDGRGTRAERRIGPRQAIGGVTSWIVIEALPRWRGRSTRRMTPHASIVAANATAMVAGAFTVPKRAHSTIGATSASQAPTAARVIRRPPAPGGGGGRRPAPVMWE